MFEELDFQRTTLGDLVLRRRESISKPGLVVYEVTLDGEFLMSSAVTDSEVALAKLGLAALEGSSWNVMVGGLGLGYTAAAALTDARVRHVTVIEFLEPVVQWHRLRLVPLGAELSESPRCEFRLADFFEVMRSAPKTDSAAYDAILVDIDHSPDALLQPENAAFYSQSGLESVARHLKPGGVLALCSADELTPSLLTDARRVFSEVATNEVEFYNPFMGEEDRNWVLVAKL